MRLSYAAIITCVMLALGLASARASDGSAHMDAFRVIVNPSTPVQNLDRKFLRSVFLKRVTQWPDGQVIYPVDLDPSQEARQRFSHDVLERNIEAVKIYWQQAIFSGRDVPPPELASSEDVVKYVLGHKGAIGYVSTGVDVGEARTVAIK